MRNSGSLRQRWPAEESRSRGKLRAKRTCSFDNTQGTQEPSWLPQPRVRVASERRCHTALVQADDGATGRLCAMAVVERIFRRVEVELSSRSLRHLSEQKASSQSWDPPDFRLRWGRSTLLIARRCRPRRIHGSDHRVWLCPHASNSPGRLADVAGPQRARGT